MKFGFLGDNKFLFEDCGVSIWLVSSALMGPVSDCNLGMCSWIPDRALKRERGFLSFLSCDSVEFCLRKARGWLKQYYISVEKKNKIPWNK